AAGSSIGCSVRRADTSDSLLPGVREGTDVTGALSCVLLETARSRACPCWRCASIGVLVTNAFDRFKAPQGREGGPLILPPVFGAHGPITCVTNGGALSCGGGQRRHSECRHRGRRHCGSWLCVEPGGPHQIGNSHPPRGCPGP